MKKILLCSLSLSFVAFAQAQKKQKPVTAYAITGVQKGNTNWTEVRLVDVNTGEELQTIYSSANDAEILNARTGKPVAKRDAAANTLVETQALEPTRQIIKKEDGKTIVFTRRIATTKPQYDQPFATHSAACAYDKKSNRLYYTPMGIAQLRYIDLKAKSPKVFYFEDEAFGVVKSKGDVSAQITRMVIAADGNGYALSNDAKHLIQFTLKKNPVITDLGPLANDLTNGRFSVNSNSSYGGDMIADKDNNLWLITAARTVYKISLDSKVASYVGTIKGLPRGFSTNGAVSEGNSNVIVSSSSNTEGYYRFDLNTLQAEKVSNGIVFNASDLANASFAFDKKDKKPEEVKDVVVTEEVRRPAASTIHDVVVNNAISVYPNPVREGFFKVSFADQKPGRYQIQLLDGTGKLVESQQANIGNKLQVEEFRMTRKVAAGNYLVKVTSEDGSYNNTSKIIVQ
ncbi:MAG: T9SS type A sorting domain-containing protein [Chitinophagaceae bacterium]|nr:MAG: T9SS type A sorting domain-containing protein [Chitinophagaceae bacterium]